MAEDESNMQAKYYEFQMINEQLKELAQQAQVLEEQINDLNTTMEALDVLEKTEEKTELLVPVSQGIFAKTTLKENDKLLVNVGANVVVDKNVKQTKEIIADRLKRMQEFNNQTVENMEALNSRAKELLAELQSMVAEEESG